jgi:hypothetical protein
MSRASYRGLRLSVGAGIAVGIVCGLPHTASAQQISLQEPLPSVSTAMPHIAAPPSRLVLPATPANVPLPAEWHRTPAVRPAALAPLYVSFGLLQALDTHSTLSAVGDGHGEANPAMKGLVNQPAAFIAAKIGATAATVYVAERLWRRHRVAAVVLMVAVNGAYGAVVASNYGR